MKPFILRPNGKNDFNLKIEYYRKYARLIFIAGFDHESTIYSKDAQTFLKCVSEVVDGNASLVFEKPNRVDRPKISKVVISSLDDDFVVQMHNYESGYFFNGYRITDEEMAEIYEALEMI